VAIVTLLKSVMSLLLPLGLNALSYSIYWSRKLIDSAVYSDSLYSKENCIEKHFHRSKDLSSYS